MKSWPIYSAKGAVLCKIGSQPSLMKIVRDVAKATVILSGMCCDRCAKDGEEVVRYLKKGQVKS